MRFPFLFVIILILLSAGIILAGENEPNWCYEGQTWGDGRCNHPDSNINDYNWRIGWLLAHCELGLLPAEACFVPEDSVIVGGDVNTTPPSYFLGSTD
jgi:hypothetical protein